MNESLNFSAEELKEMNVACVHDQPVRPDTFYCLSNPYAARKSEGKWHLNNISSSRFRKKVLSLPLHDFTSFHFLGF